MAPKGKEKAVSAKGDEAEDMVLKYLKKVNRPYASTDISANLKNAVSKAIAQKSLLSLADKGLLTKKEYGKQTVFVYPQEEPDEEARAAFATIDADIAAIAEPLEEARKKANKLQNEVNALKATLTNKELTAKIAELKKTNATHLSHLTPLRAGADPISPEELKEAETVWVRERKEWISRRKTFRDALAEVCQNMPNDELAEWKENNGIEEDSEEAKAVEKGRFCASPTSKFARK